MKLSKIIRSHKWHTVKSTMLEIYPGTEKNIERYEFVFEKLNFLPPMDCPFTIHLSVEINEGTGKEYIYASSTASPTEMDDQEYQFYLPLYYTSWREWLGMQMDKKTISEYSKPEIIVHCLVNMTTISFNEDEIEAERNKFYQELVKFVNMPEEELWKRAIPHHKEDIEQEDKEQNKKAKKE